jgi:hypothetical protein
MRVQAGRRRPGVETVLCFLCREPIAPGDLQDAYERILTDRVPGTLDFAHSECADREGYLDQPDGEDERPGGRG